MRGAVTVSVNKKNFRLISGSDLISSYAFHTQTVRHHFCPKCGIYTHHGRRSDPIKFGVNAACIIGVSPFDFSLVPVADGNRHPSDTNEPAQDIGYLVFVRK